jgi:hypothetical protein
MYRRQVDILTRDRYNYFIHASADMISSFSVDLDARWGSEKNYLHIVSPNMVLGEDVAKMDEVDEM